MQLIFYTRKQCPLCIEGKGILLQLQKDYNFQIVEKDIDTSDEWTEKYGLMIPVVEVDGKVIQYGIIDPFTIEESLKKE